LLSSIDLRENKLGKLSEIKKLEGYKTLTQITLLGNPLQEEMGDVIKKEILMFMPFLKSINEEEVT
jgi:hypothetical protein